MNPFLFWALGVFVLTTYFASKEPTISAAIRADHDSNNCWPGSASSISRRISRRP